MIRKLFLFGIVIITLAAWGSFEWMAYLKREQEALPNPLFAPQRISLPTPTAKDWGNLGASLQATLPIDPAAAAKLAQPQLSRAYFFCESEIRRLAKDWPTRAGTRFSSARIALVNNLNWYSGRWAVGPLPATETQPALYLHSLTLSVALRHPHPEMENFELIGHYEPVDRWGVEWRMIFDKGLTQAKLVSWQALPPRGSNAPAAAGQSTSAEAVKWEHYIPLNEYSKTRHVELHWSHLNRLNLIPERAEMDHLYRFWASPEDFQAAALVELDSFDRFIADWKDRGFQVSLSTPPFVGGNPPDKTTAPNDFIAKVLTGAKQHMQTRREILFEHTDELHQAMHESFPAMLQLLNELQRPAHLP